MAISLTRLSGGNTPADGSDPRTFPAIWNASATAIEGALADTGASVTVSETAPVSPAEGDLWLNSTEAKMYVYYDDGSSAQWVAAVGGTVPSQGKILQVVSTTKTDTFTTSSLSFVDVTGLSASITPSSSSSKILVVVTTAGGTVTENGMIRLVRDATPVGNGTGGSLENGFMQFSPAAPLNATTNTASMNFLDSPASTSSLTYKVEARIIAAGTLYLGRRVADTNYGIPSTITLMEVAG